MSGTRPRTARTTRTAIALALGALVAALLPLSQATAAKPAPDDTIASSIRFTKVMDAGISLPVTPGSNGLWYVVQGRVFEVDLEFVNAAGEPRPLSTTKSVTVSVKYAGVVLDSVEVGQLAGRARSSPVPDSRSRPPARGSRSPPSRTRSRGRPAGPRARSTCSSSPSRSPPER